MLSPEHWLELFRLVGLPRGTTLDKLTFGDILSVAEMITAKGSELKVISSSLIAWISHVQRVCVQELNSRAQGEVSIRDALRELDLWGASAVFSLTSYLDTNGKELMLVKDWRDLFNQV